MIYNYQNILTIYQKHINILFDKFLLHIKRKERIIEWIQEGTNSLDMMDVKMCPCMGAKCRGKCSPYGVCPVHLGGKCKQLVFCGIHLGG